jgi:CheY-like chemotaxis protein
MPKTILVVDDDRMSSELVKRKLLDNGYEVLTAGDGEQALAQLNQKPVDLILLDVEMPTMNGYTFIMEKNKIPACTAIPVIVLTGHNEMQPLFKRHNVRGYLLKPLNIEELLAKLAETLTPKPN